MKKYPFIPYESIDIPADSTLSRAKEFYEFMNFRRSVRDFSDAPVEREVIEKILLTAGTAPSGAHKQPWTYCAVSDPDIKKQIRKAAEEEEYKSYNSRMPDEWLKDLEPLGTDWHKEFIDIAPWLIIAFRQNYRLENGEKKNNYYVSESVGIAAGMLISAIHHAGLVTLTHTPSPMGFLSKILNRPENEKAFLLLPVGYPAADAQVPDIHRKSLEEISVWFT